MTVVLAICGASGAIYGIRTLAALLSGPRHVHLIVSNAGFQVLRHELGPSADFRDAGIGPFLAAQGIQLHAGSRLSVHAEHDLFAPPASGSYRHDGMIVAPCTMKTLAAIATGLADGLIHRAADVCLKERKPLVLLTRETPLNLVHIENMRRAALAGAVIMPPCPSFYAKPASILEMVDATVARSLDQLGIHTDLIRRWGETTHV